MKKSDLIITGPKNSKKIFIFAHGAGAPMDSDWMNEVTSLLANEKIKVVRFEFPYMAERRTTGKKRPPNSKKVLIETFYEVFDLLKISPSECYVGGKSMGGRMATLMADEAKFKGVICLGFPFHAPGREPKDRIDHLKKIKTPILMLQGTRDSMGSFDEVQKYDLSKKIKIHWLEDGDHSLKPRVKSGHTLDEHLSTAAKVISKFIK